MPSISILSKPLSRSLSRNAFAFFFKSSSLSAPLSKTKPICSYGIISFISGNSEFFGKEEIVFTSLSTSARARFISVPASNSNIIFALPSTAEDFVFLTLSMYLTFSSIGLTSDSSISTGLAPTQFIFTVI